MDIRDKISLDLVLQDNCNAVKNMIQELERRKASYKEEYLAASEEDRATIMGTILNLDLLQGRHQATLLSIEEQIHDKEQVKTRYSAKDMNGNTVTLGR